MKRIITITFLVFSILNLFSRNDSIKKKEKQWYYTWGYTRAWYSNTDIHFKDLSNNYHPETGKNNYYDFTIYNTVAHDRPDFDKIKDVINVTIPQYVFRIGYYFNKSTGLELNYDHTKYVVDNYQTVRIKGQISGVYMDKDTILDPVNFLRFEHTDGANFWMINFVKKFTFINKGKDFSASLIGKPGLGIVFPRTDVTLFGERLNNKWHVAGGIIGAEGGLRLEFLKYCVFEFVGKASFANYAKSLVLGKGNGTAQHFLKTAQLTATFGLKFGD